MNSKKIFTLLTVAAFTSTVFAQKVENSVSQIISSKAAKGSLYDYNDEGAQIQLTYLLKDSKKGKLVETYNFNKSTLAFEGSKEELVTDEKRFAQKTGSTRGSKLLRVYPNLLGKPKLKLGYIEYSYVNRARIEKFIVTDELTPKGDAGEKMFYVHHRTEEAKNNQAVVLGQNRLLNIGDVQLIAAEKKEPLFTHYTSMIISAEDLSYRSIEKIQLEYSYQSICGDNLPNGNVAVVLRSFTMNHFPKPNASKGVQAKYKLAKEYHLKYLEFDPSGKVVQNVNIPMEQPASGYTIVLDIVPGDDGSVAVIGTTRPLKLLANALARMGGPAAVYDEEKNIYYPKVDHLFLAKMQDNQLVFAKTHPINAYLQNGIPAPGSEVPKDIKSMKQVSHALPQNMQVIGDKNLIVLKDGWFRQHIIQVNNQGEIEANYFFDPTKGNMLNASMEFYTNESGKRYAFFYEQPKIKIDSPSEEWAKAAEKRTGSLYAIDPVTKTIGPKVDLTPEASLDVHDPFFFEDANTFVTLGQGRKKEIVLSRIKL